MSVNLLNILIKITKINFRESEKITIIIQSTSDIVSFKI